MFLKLLALSFISFLPYLHSCFFGEFVFDDAEAIIKNKDVTTNPLIDVFYHDFWGNNIASNLSHKSYRPLTTLTFRLNYILSDYTLNPIHFKVTNVLCHWVCCLLVWLSYKLILEGLHSRSKEALDVSWHASMLFAVHPIHVEAVSGIVGRADILCGVTFFISFIMYHNAIKEVTTVCSWKLCGSVAVAAVSMLFKENGITVLGFCIVYDIVTRPKVVKIDYLTPPRVKLAMVKRLLILVSSIIILVSGRWLIMGATKPEFKAVDNPAAFNDSKFVKIATYNYIYYLNFLLMIWPEWLCFDWSMGCVPLINEELDVRVLCITLLHLYGILVLRFLFNQKVSKKSKKLVILSVSLMVIPFLPASNIFFPVGFVLAERVLYIPSAGFCLLVVLGLNKLMIRKIVGYKAHVLTRHKLLAFLLFVFCVRSNERAWSWANEYDLFYSGLSACPLNAKVHYNVAKQADAHNETRVALAAYRRAIDLYPEYYQAMNNLGNLLKHQKKYSEAEDYLLMALQHKHDFPPAWMNLGIVLAHQKRYKESHDAYVTAIKYRNNYPDCFYNLGNLFLEVNQTEQAAAAWQHAIQLRPKHTLAWTNLLSLLDNTGQTERASQIAPEALAQLPHSASVHFAVANIYGKLGRYGDAETHFERALSLFGNQAQAIHYTNLGVLYHRWKKYHQAEEMYSYALKIDPMFKSARNNLRLLQKHNLIQD